MSPGGSGALGCVLVAAGRGERLGVGRAKALVEVAGRPLLAWALDGLSAAGVEQIVVVGPADDLDEVRRWAPTATVVAGGDTRQESVSSGLAALAADVEFVLVHDAARCLTPPQTIGAVAAALRAGARVVVPALPVIDTLRARAGGVVDRSGLVSVQTPQGFLRSVLERAHAGADPTATDDALLAERDGEHVTLVDGHPEALKVTTPLDLLVAAAVLEQRGGAVMGSLNDRSGGRRG